MPTKKRKYNHVPVCKHKDVIFEPSPAAAKAGFKWTTEEQRATAANAKVLSDISTFPGPLVLPEDEIALYPSDRGTTFSSWLNAKYRNKITAARRTIYVVPPPTRDPKLSFIDTWSVPLCGTSTPKEIDKFDTTSIVEYVSAFYHGLPVKLLPEGGVKFSPWEDTRTYLRQLEDGSMKSPVLVGADVKGQRIGIRTRPAPDGRFQRQLCVNDLIDVTMTMLPEDAYAMVMLVDQDLYEDEEDIFICGRAYGGSRVAIISSARYNPLLDKKIELDLIHAWPNSHCVEYVNLWDLGAVQTHPLTNNTLSPMRAAAKAVAVFQRKQAEKMSARWLGRLCRTVTHELGHCFGMGHCVYYACCMQGSASLHEDIRQPPYLCPVDLAKVLHATGASEREHLFAMQGYCQKHLDVELFAAYDAWLDARLASGKMTWRSLEDTNTNLMIDTV